MLLGADRVRGFSGLRLGAQKGTLWLYHRHQYSQLRLPQRSILQQTMSLHRPLPAAEHRRIIWLTVSGRRP